MTAMKNQLNSQESINELNFRVEFKSDYGIDYLEALDKIKQMKQSTARNWHQVLVKNKLI